MKWTTRTCEAASAKSPGLRGSHLMNAFKGVQQARGRNHAGARQPRQRMGPALPEAIVNAQVIERQKDILAAAGG